VVLIFFQCYLEQLQEPFYEQLLNEFIFIFVVKQVKFIFTALFKSNLNLHSYLKLLVVLHTCLQAYQV
jgi:hypothetical protein